VNDSGYLHVNIERTVDSSSDECDVMMHGGSDSCQDRLCAGDGSTALMIGK
jgi:hypothetical protein